MKNIYILDFGGRMAVVESVHKNREELLVAIQETMAQCYGQPVGPMDMISVMCLDRVECCLHGFRIVSGPQEAIPVGPVAECHAVTRWYPEDIMGIAALQGVELNRDEALAWLEQNEHWFKELLMKVGVDILADMDFTEAKKVNG